jgi:phosphomevalonate kinase
MSAYIKKNDKVMIRTIQYPSDYLILLGDQANLVKSEVSKV